MTTKLELSQLLATRNKELYDARVRISVLEGELALRPRNAEVRGRYQPPTHFAAARDAAMRMGTSVKVEMNHA